MNVNAKKTLENIPFLLMKIAIEKRIHGRVKAKFSINFYSLLTYLAIKLSFVFIFLSFTVTWSYKYVLFVNCFSFYLLIKYYIRFKYLGSSIMNKNKIIIYYYYWIREKENCVNRGNRIEKVQYNNQEKNE